MNYGLKRQSVDVRDYILTAPWRMTASLPTSFVLPFADRLPHFDQTVYNACGPNAFAECACYDELARGLPSPTIPSRMFVYYNARLLSGDVGSDGGVDNRSMFKSIARFGYVYEDEYAYNEHHLLVKPPVKVYDDALIARSIAYSGVQLVDQQIRGVLASYKVPLVWGGDLYKQFEGDQAATTGVIADPPPGATPVGGHDMTILGFDQNGFGKMSEPAYLLRNHWKMPDGSLWGDKGNCYISAKYITSRSASDAWALNAVYVPKQTPKSHPVAFTPRQVIEYLAGELGVKIT